MLYQDAEEGIFFPLGQKRRGSIMSSAGQRTGGQLRMEQFLKVHEVIDWTHPAVTLKARELAKSTTGALETAKRCFV
jgi:hypothetical protein